MMPLCARDAFKAGFLSRCIEDGLSSDQIAASVKVATDLMEKKAVIGNMLGNIAGLAKDTIGATAKYGIPAAILAPPVLGAAAGYGAAKMTDIDDRDFTDVQDHEVIDEYHRQSEKLRRQKAVRDYLKSKKTTGRIFM